MLSNTEYQYIKDLTESYYINGYKYYICYTNNPNNSYNQSYYDVICYYSKNEITENNYTYTINNESKICSIDSKNPTSQYKNESKTCNNFSGTITISNKEFIYSNIGKNSNIINEFEQDYKYYNNISLYNISILMVLILIFLYKFIKTILKIQ